MLSDPEFVKGLEEAEERLEKRDKYQLKKWKKEKARKLNTG